MIKPKPAQRQVRKKYKKVNGCTQSPSIFQILSLALMVAILVLQAILIKSITDISNAILNFLLGFSYALLLLVTYDYLMLLNIDPVDPRLLELPFQERRKNKKLLSWCGVCKADVHKYSHHCKRCNRCVEEFDHHCKFVNNCIGKQNYVNFFRILISLLSFLSTQIAQGVWVLICLDGYVKWVGLSLVAISGLVVPVLLYLVIFHCYISFWEYGTTLRYLRGDVLHQDIKPQQKLSQAVLVNQLIIYAKEANQKGRQIEIDYQNLPTGTHLRRDFYLF